MPTQIIHPIPPEADGHANTLILGSFPSVASRACAFFYGHRQNRFWPLLATLCGEDPPETVEEKKSLLHRHHIALWDVLASCEIEGSADSSIRNPVANDLRPLLAANPITRIFVNGKTAEKYYNRLILPTLGRSATVLPSTSPANAACRMDDLLAAWRVILT